VNPGLVISVIGLLFLILTTMLGLLIRVVQKWTRTEERLNDVIDDVKTLAENSDVRIRWLEEHTWAPRAAPGRRGKVGP
jgi:hypothetical protein